MSYSEDPFVSSPTAPASSPPMAVDRKPGTSFSPLTSPSKAGFEPTESLPTLITFLNNVPPQLTAVLVELGPLFARTRWLLEALSWKVAYSDSWLLIGAWWGLCLFSDFAFRYLLLALIAAAYLRLSTRAPAPHPPATEQSLQATVIDLSTIRALVPSLPRPALIPLKKVARVVTILYVPFLVSTFFIRLRVIIAICGTLLLVYRAPWARTIRVALWRSAWFRRGIFEAWVLLSGERSSAKIIYSNAYPSDELGKSIRFLITVYENQRWWVGLDWTAALLPGERPSWSSATQEPLSPPSAFNLPRPTCVYMDDGRGGIMKRTATWSWDEDEWKALVKKEQKGVKRVEKELPILKDDVSANSNRLGRAKQKIQDVGAKLKAPSEEENGDEETVEVPHPGEGHCDEVHDDGIDELLTDGDGWVYGDNKWKMSGSSGGLGKYTRYRRWTRTAVLNIVDEATSAEEARAHSAKQQEAIFSAKETEAREQQSLPRRSSFSPLSRRMSSSSGASVDDDSEKDGLRKRLKAALRKTTGTA